ncbi:uncharacterized protein LOC118433236 [Folsomia candida]|uniref:uncharacterized protein LOC118433236 n=1 Tax=Folsomia candida TaxID=158441 RepID=UPI001604BC74|nr:uncharacterized protein LOC118433236 [Folsomia candida]
MTKKTRKQKILFKKQQNVESDALLESNAKKLMSTDPTDDQTNLGTFSEQVISIGGTNKACDDPAKNDNKENCNLATLQALEPGESLLTKGNTDDVPHSPPDRIMLIVGPEKYTLKLVKIFEKFVSPQNSVKLSTSACDALKYLRTHNLSNVLFVIESFGDSTHILTEIDETLTILCQNHGMSVDAFDFILAKENPHLIRGPYLPDSSNRGRDIHAFVQNYYKRPLITVLFQNGWERDSELGTMLRNMFLLNRSPSIHGSPCY